MVTPEPIKFLLVDDTAENLVALEPLLRRDGLELLLARSGAEALELLLLHDELKSRPRVKRLLYILGAVSDDQRDAGRCQRIGSTDHAFDQGEARDAVQDLWHLRLHPRALAGREHYDVNVSHE